MSRQQLQDSEAAALPDKAMLATVLNYLKTKNLKETEEILKKELSHQGDDSVISLDSFQLSAVGQSGAEPMKYEESYTSKAPSTSTTPPLTSTTATQLAKEDPPTKTFDPQHSESPETIREEESEENSPSIQPMLPFVNGSSRVPIYSGNLAGVSSAISITKALGSSLSSSTAASATKTLDKNPLWLPTTPVFTTSTAATSTHHQSLLSPTTVASSLGLGGNKPIFLPGTATPVVPPSVPTTSLGLGSKPIFLPTGSTSIMAPSGNVSNDSTSSSQNVSVCPPPMMYQIVSSSCMPRPILTPVLTMLKSPPGLVATPPMLLPNPAVPAVSSQSLGLQSVVAAPATEKPASQPDKARPHSTSEIGIKPVSPVIAETGQVVHSHEFSPVSSTSSASSHAPRTLASIPHSELTADLIELKAFAEDFKTRRIRLGFTQGSVGQSLAEKGYNNFAQSTISRFEQMQLSPANAATIRVILEKWLVEAECPDMASTTANQLPQMASRKRKKRAVFTAQTRAILEDFFSKNPRPNRQIIEGISAKLDLLPEEVRVWFCNKRQKSKSGGSIHRTSFDRESSLSTNSSGVPSPTLSDGGSQKRRSPSPPKTPFTIEELSKSSTAASTVASSPTHFTPAVSPLGIMASVTQSVTPPILFNNTGNSQQVFNSQFLPGFQVSNTRA